MRLVWLHTLSTVSVWCVKHFKDGNMDQYSLQLLTKHWMQQAGSSCAHQSDQWVVEREITTHSFIGMCRMRWFLTVLRSCFHSSLLCTLSLPSIPPVKSSILPSSCHLFLGLVVSKFILKTFLGILFSSILCTWPNQCKLFCLIASAILGF